jgi:hypothetical protein
MEKMQQKIRPLDPGGASQAKKKTRKKTAHNSGEERKTKPTARDRNPSACFVKPEYGPGRIDDEAKNKPRDGSFSTERRKEIPHELESTPIITRK